MLIINVYLLFLGKLVKVKNKHKMVSWCVSLQNQKKKKNKKKIISMRKIRPVSTFKNSKKFLFDLS